MGSTEKAIKCIYCRMATQLGNFVSDFCIGLIKNEAKKVLFAFYAEMDEFLM